MVGIKEMSDSEIKEMVSDELRYYEFYLLPKSAVSESLLNELKEIYEIEEKYVYNTDELSDEADEDELIEGIHDEGIQLGWTERWHWQIKSFYSKEKEATEYKESNGKMYIEAPEELTHPDEDIWDNYTK